MFIITNAIKLKDRLRGFIENHVFSSKLSDINTQLELLSANRKHFEAERADWRKYKDSLSITDLVREQLKGFSPKMLDTDDDILVIKDSEGDRESFLSDVKQLSKNEALFSIIEYLTRDQVLYTTKEAINTEQVNFGRASINGMSLVKEEIERIATEYDAEHAGEEEFDKHSVT